MIKLLFSFIASLPNSWAQGLGWLVGSVINSTAAREKRTAVTNIALCFPQLSEPAQRQLVKKTLRENAKTLIELPRIFKKGGQYAISLVTEVNGLEHYQRALEKQTGVILLAPHLGNWELTVHYLNQFSPITAMYDPPKQPFLDAIMKAGRQSSGATLVPANGKGVRELLKTLKKGGVIGILPDQVPQHDNAGVYAPFMGQTAFTLSLIHNLLKRSEATCLMTFAERLENGKGYRLHILPAPAAIEDDDAETSASALNQGVADCIAIAPAQYQWTYKRFKHQPNGQPEPY